MPIHRIAILGGTGFVGRHLAERLCQDGHHVRVLTRNRERHREDLLVLPGLELVQTDVHDAAAFEKQIADRDVVINLVGILNERVPGRTDFPPGRHGDFERNHIELPRLVANTCARLGIRRLLHMSALGASPLAPSAYLRSKGIGEEIVRQAGEDSARLGHFAYLDGPKLVWGRGLWVTVFRPSVIFGEGDSFFNRFASLLRRIPGVLPLAQVQARMQPVWVEDVVEAFAKSIDSRSTFGKAYCLCGPKVYTLGELVRYTQTLTGTHRLVVPVCDSLATLQASLLEKLPGKLLTRDNLRSLSVASTCSGSDLEQAFGLKPASVESIVPTYLGRQADRAGRLSEIRNRRTAER